MDAGGTNSITGRSRSLCVCFLCRRREIFRPSKILEERDYYDRKQKHTTQRNFDEPY